MEVRAHYAARCARNFDGSVQFAEVIVTAAPTTGGSTVQLSNAALATLQQVFADDADFLARHCVTAGVDVQLRWANVAREMPLVDQTAFTVEVVAIRVSGNLGRQRSGFLLTTAAMDAIAQYLLDFERQHQSSKGST